ncbi:MAG: tetratricopeptide repeat protein [Clostridium argentinense]|uniref:tetratricopeptide repeat protein n=1 Tax=Clostridium butanoliproducens TaxID=2991837 RepID=UPI001D3D6E03|nr:tetratricopeptide repeat protein [Clostridium butanoliproducens]MBS5822595.1 tetratricopeptide repeat protein [Clostridium argentinense]
MSIKSYLLEKLSKVLFLEIKKGSKINNFTFKENTYLPVRSEAIVEKTKSGDNLKDIPINLFLEGMFYVLGTDKDFKFNNIYKDLIKDIPDSLKLIKSIIFKEIKEERYEEAYILIKGLIVIESTKDNYSKALLLVDEIRKKNSVFKEEELNLIEEGKSISEFPIPYLYEAGIKRDDKDMEGALFSINQYLALGGEKTDDVIEFKASLDMITSYDKAKIMVYESPKEALEILLPLLEELGDNAEIYYYIAIAYRILENYEKAIYYLNDSLAISSDYVEVINELGINYACLGEYETAIKYFRTAFEVTKSIEICTNLIMCYLNIGDNKQAKIHFDIAKKLDPNDEVLKDIEKIIK